MTIVKSTERTADGEEIDIYIEVDRVTEAEDPYADTRGGDPEKAVRNLIGKGLDLSRHCAVKVMDIAFIIKVRYTPNLERLAVNDVFWKDVPHVFENCYSINKMGDAVKPNDFEVQFAIKLDSEIGVPVITKVGAKAQMQVTMKWTLK